MNKLGDLPIEPAVLLEPAFPQLSLRPQVARVSQRPLFRGALRRVDQFSERAVFESARHVHRFFEPLLKTMRGIDAIAAGVASALHRHHEDLPSSQ
jgi:hypothetical protein